MEQKRIATPGMLRYRSQTASKKPNEQQLNTKYHGWFLITNKSQQSQLWVSISVTNAS
jgi:hypothetical protein